MKAMTFFCGGSEKSCFEQFHKELFKIFLNIFYEEVQNIHVTIVPGKEVKPLSQKVLLCLYFRVTVFSGRVNQCQSLLQL